MEEGNQNSQKIKKTPHKPGLLWTILIIVVIIAAGVLVYQSRYSDTSGILLTAQVRTTPNGDEEAVLDSVTVPSDGGFVVLYEETADGSRVIVGQSKFLTGGEHSNVVVPLTKEASKRRFQRKGTNERAARYLVVTHQDSGDQVFDEDEDTPYVDESGEEISGEVVIEEDSNDGTEDSESVGGNDAGGEGTELPPADGEEDGTSMDVSATITYTDDGFSPSEITVAVGDTVTWMNNSSRNVWPASAMHPTHTVYPGTDNQDCETAPEGSMFDSCGDIAPGESWSFTFDELGEWGYHDHLLATEFGKVIVE